MSNKNTVDFLKEENAKLMEEVKALKAQLEKKPVARDTHTADETIRAARAAMRIQKLNVPKDIKTKIIAFNEATGMNEGVGRELGRFSIKNDKVGDDRASQERYLTAKSIDTSGFYVMPEFGIVYGSIRINKAGMRVVYSLDRQAKKELAAYLETVPKADRVVK